MSPMCSETMACEARDVDAGGLVYKLPKVRRIEAWLWKTATRSAVPRDAPRISPSPPRSQRRPLPLSSLNHVSRLCSDVNASRRFYRDLLGMVEVKRPDSFTFEGAWLLGSGIGIHLIQGNPPPRPSDINPQRDHVSFHSDDIPAVAQQLRDAGVPYVEAPVSSVPATAGLRASAPLPCRALGLVMRAGVGRAHPGHAALLPRPGQQHD